MGRINAVLSQSKIRWTFMRIFVTVGNHPMPFDRLLKAVDNIAMEGSDQFFIQCGKTEFVPRYTSSKDFLNAGEMQNQMGNADLVITHGGWGTIEECLTKGKKIIAVPRIMGPEHYHAQDDLVKALEKQGHLIGVYHIDKLKEAIDFSRTFQPKPLMKGSASYEIIRFIQSI